MELAEQPQERSATPMGAEMPEETVSNAALWSLAAQHLSSTWGARSFEFAAYLFLVELFPSNLLPASIFGFASTGLTIVGAGYVGTLVDRTARLRFVRCCIVAQKATAAAAYAVFLILFLRFEQDARDGTNRAAVWTLFTLVTGLAAALAIETIAILVAIERDWVTTMAGRNGALLTKLNTCIRRIDLLSKLVAPLFVSAFTSAVSYPFAAAFLLGLAGLTLAFEFLWINVVYSRSRVLATEETERVRLRAEEARAQGPQQRRSVVEVFRATPAKAVEQARDWLEFIAHPVFPSCLAISLLYMTVLAFDGTMLGYLKAHAFSDAFLAGMRGVCVVTGLLGTMLMPLLERKLGLVRAGAWAIWLEVATLIPVLLAFFIQPPSEGAPGPAWNTAMLFTGMALSRIGLWAFDLVQLKEVQLALQDHPKRNHLMALQFSLQNVLDLVKYILTAILSSPPQFRWAALASFISVALGGVSYSYYCKKERGHILHLHQWAEKAWGKGA